MIHRLLFGETLGQAGAKTDWEVHDYCLMTHLAHLLYWNQRDKKK